MIFKDVALIIEGGGTRCSFTAGVLDFFLEKDLVFPLVFASSAGSLTGINYISKQKRRYFSAVLSKNLLKGRKEELFGENLWDMKKIVDFIESILTPFDFETFTNSYSKMLITTTNAETGECEYYNATKSLNQDILNKIVAASCSIPGRCKAISLNREYYFDGGYSDDIPVFEAIERGYSKCLLISTRPKGYRKEKAELTEDLLDSTKTYKEVQNAIKNRHIRYNDSMICLELMEKLNKSVIIAPTREIELENTKFDYLKMSAAYRQGYSNAKTAYNDIMKLYYKKDDLLW